MKENYVPLVASCLLNDYGVLTTHYDLAPDVLRFEPPLTVTQEQLDQAIDALDEVLGLGMGRLVMSVGKGSFARMFHKAGGGL